MNMKMDPQQLIYTQTQRKNRRTWDFVRVCNHFLKKKILTDLK